MNKEINHKKIKEMTKEEKRIYNRARKENKDQELHNQMDYTQSKYTSLYYKKYRDEMVVERNGFSQY